MRSLRGRRGQIVIPALLIFPSLILFIYLIFETAKLSREKIRHQFAIDAAVFVEMSNYSDFLNRSAYVNGAFPMRIFREGFHDTKLDCLGRDPCPGMRPFDDILYADGVFPRDVNEPDRVEYTSEDSWDIGYGGNRAGMNSDSPTIGSPDCIFTGNATRDRNADAPTGTAESNCVTLISLNTAKFWNINWDDANQVYKLYVQIYQLLGSVESAQFNVLKRLARDHNFLKKSYWLNTGGDEALAEAGGLVQSFDRNAGVFPNSVRFHCAQNLLFHGNQLVHSWGQPYQIWASDPPPPMPNTITECGGLFQLVTVDRGILSSMSGGNGGAPGWPVEARWTAPVENYFSVPINELMVNEDSGPRVRATISVWRGRAGTAAVWPWPTPKFQVRLYP